MVREDFTGSPLNPGKTWRFNFYSEIHGASHGNDHLPCSTVLERTEIHVFMHANEVRPRSTAYPENSKAGGGWTIRMDHISRTTTDIQLYRAAARQIFSCVKLCICVIDGRILSYYGRKCPFFMVYSMHIGRRSSWKYFRDNFKPGMTPWWYWLCYCWSSGL